MINTQKKSFEQFIIHSSDADKIVSTSHKNDFVNNIQQAECQYYQIAGEISEKYERLRILSFIAEQHDRHKTCKYHSAIEKSIGDIHHFVHFEMKDRYLSFRMDRGNSLRHTGDIKNAMAVWEELLKANPEDNRIYSQLCSVSDDGPWKKKAEEMRQVYRFHYLQSFSHPSLKFADQLMMDNSGTMLFVSDPRANVIHQYTIDGYYNGRIAIGTSLNDGPGPGIAGLFKDKDTLYVSHPGARRIFAFTPEGEVTEAIDLEKITKAEYEYTLPFFGCTDKENIYLSCTDPNMYRHHIVCYDTRNPEDSFRQLDTSKLIYPEQIILHRGELYLTDGATNIVYKYDNQQKYFKIFIRLSLPGTLRRCVFHRNDIFLNIDNDILKMDHSGAVIFKADLMRITDVPDIGVNNMVVTGYGEDTFLFVSDYKHNRIHKFLV